MRNKVINNKGSLKQIVIEKVSVLVNIDCHSLLPNLRESAEGIIKITYMCDNARKRIKIQMKKKGKSQEPVLQRADIFRARPTHLSPTPRKETRKSAVYDLARTCTQERPRPSAKLIANTDDIRSQKTGK